MNKSCISEISKMNSEKCTYFRYRRRTPVHSERFSRPVISHPLSGSMLAAVVAEPGWSSSLGGALRNVTDVGGGCAAGCTTACAAACKAGCFRSFLGFLWRFSERFFFFECQAGCAAACAAACLHSRLYIRLLLPAFEENLLKFSKV